MVGVNRILHVVLWPLQMYCHRCVHMSALTDTPNSDKPKKHPHKPCTQCCLFKSGYCSFIWEMDEVPVVWLWFYGRFLSANQLWKEDSTRCQSPAEALGRKSDSHTGTTEEDRNKKFVLVYLPYLKNGILVSLKEIHGLNPGVLVEVSEAKY